MSEYDGKASRLHRDLHDNRETRIHIAPLAEGAWYVRVRDGGPFDGSRKEIDTDEMLALVHYYLTAREGSVVIEREASEVTDTRAAKIHQQADERSEVVS